MQIVKPRARPQQHAHPSRTVWVVHGSGVTRYGVCINSTLREWRTALLVKQTNRDADRA